MKKVSSLVGQQTRQVGLPMTDPVTFGIDKQTLLSILQRAASQERTVIEFRTKERDDGETVLDSAMDITEHHTKLEEKFEYNE